MFTFEIGGRKIGEGYPVYIIAEGCDNHMGNVDVAKEMCRQAKLAGADCIKFQHHLPDEEMLKDVPMSSNFDIPLYDFLKLHALTLEQHAELMKFCRKIGIQYLCTPFSLKAAYELNEIGVDAFKIGSGEMTDIPSLVKIAQIGKPMIISTGMSTLDEIQRTYEELLPFKIPIAFTNCLSEYPPKYEDVNLNVIGRMRERFPNAIIGHSDHTSDLYTCYAAVALGAALIEKHVILSKQIPGPDQTVSIDFYDLHNLVDGIRKIEAALGAEKVVHEDEKVIREWAFRSIVSCCPIKKGQMIKKDMVWSKRPGTGIPSYKMNEVIGKKAVCDIEENVLLKYSDFE
ncbi:N-acetylneuraminate synthase family protein [Lachnospiraceae bacterium 54-11]